MKSAREMFKEMGYEFKASFGIMHYSIPNNYIEFYIDKEKVTIIDCVYDRYSIDMLTLKAIIKQCEELGWLDE